jgi:hypothetical protein
MTTLNIVSTANTSRFPVYCKYSGQYSAQPAYIYLDLRNGECGADYNSQTGSTPFSHWLNNVLIFPINAQTRGSEIIQIIEDRKEDFQAILDDSSIEWDGNNNVGKFGDNSKVLLRKLGFQVNEDPVDPEGFQSYGSIGGMIDSEYLPDWLGDDIYPATNETPESFANRLHLCDGDDNYWFSDDMNSPDEILAALRHMWADDLYAGNDLPKIAAQHLLDIGTCDESQWLDELNQFANA